MTGFFAKSSILTTRNLSLFLLFVSLLVYGNTINNRYVLDDLTAITSNDYVKQGVKAIPDILVTPYHKGYKRIQDTGAIDNLYRPLSLVTFAVEYQFFKNNPTEGHLINILLFAACVIVLFLFLDRVFGRKRTGVAFIAALLFAVHPIHTEVVANIKSRDELMCFLLAISAMLLFINHVRSGKVYQLLTGCVCLFLSLLSKETAISFLLIVPLVFFFYINENRKRSVYITASVVVTTVLYLTMRYVSLKLHNGTDTSIEFIDNELSGDTSYPVRIATAFFVLSCYIKLLFVPYPLISDYSYKSLPFASIDDPLALLSFGIYLFLIIYGLYRLFKYKKDVWAFGILFFLITLVLFSNILFLIGAAMAERFLFYASVGFCLVVAQALWHWGTKNMQEKSLFAPKIWVVLAPVCIVFAIMAM
ncbi:MAG: Tetratricopeptide 2 repeat-containing protein, partial [Flavipsychrobacter sp.]|nr:Tetratricopeptide 2 repeat-containing protein [Flavipsychrobacter sp.]